MIARRLQARLALGGAAGDDPADQRQALQLPADPVGEAGGRLAEVVLDELELAVALGEQRALGVELAQQPVDRDLAATLVEVGIDRLLAIAAGQVADRLAQGLDLEVGLAGGGLELAGDRLGVDR